MWLKYTRELLVEAVKNSTSIYGVICFLGKRSAGGTHSHISRRIKEFGIDISHFTGRASNYGPKHKGGPSKKLADDTLIKRTYGTRQKTVRLRRALIEKGIPYKCVICSNEGLWQEKKLILQVNHCNGDWLDDRKENLEFLCPNCHSQTDGWNGNKGGTDILSDARQHRNRRIAKHKEKQLKDLEESKSINNNISAPSSSGRTTDFLSVNGGSCPPGVTKK